MRRILITVSCLVVLLGACGSDKKDVTSATTTEPSIETTTTAEAPANSTSTSVEITTTTSAQCPNTGATSATTPTGQPAALLTKVAVTTAGCRDTVAFTFKKSGSAVPSCKVAYVPGPFTQDGSGQPVVVAGNVFVSVRCEPAYGYDFSTGTPTYTGPKRITPTGTTHVKEVVQTGDFEGVLNWVIGLDVQRSFGITPGGVPTRLLAITFA